ncbi:unnamed protein product [Amoebophrya sp. A25]|nr:unnamed protein product [Amoebophrya sp. A25]|eukprot:GSA25T00001051001.1
MAQPTMEMTKEEIEEACLKGDLSRQWEWHSTFRDAAKNMYRTNTFDGLHMRENCVRSNYPSGYGGHVPQLKHDMLHLNTAQYEKMKLASVDPGRDTFPSFKQQKDGQATFSQQAQASTPTFGTLPDVRVQPPWAITPPICTVPSFRVTPNMTVATKK